MAIIMNSANGSVSEEMTLIYQKSDYDPSSLSGSISTPTDGDMICTDDPTKYSAFVIYGLGSVTKNQTGYFGFVKNDKIGTDDKWENHMQTASGASQYQGYMSAIDSTKLVWQTSTRGYNIPVMIWGIK